MIYEGDKSKGRIKQAVGDLTSDKDTKRKGKADEAGDKLKDRLLIRQIWGR